MERLWIEPGAAFSNRTQIIHHDVMSQLDMFGPAPRPTPKLPTPEDVRPELAEILDLLRHSDAMPLSQKDLRFWRTVFPQMSRWLPETERAEMCSAFAAELCRLEGRAPA